MKNETKRKIIQWVTKRLDYIDDKPINSIIPKKEIAILTASSQRLYNIEKMEQLNKNNMIEKVVVEDIVQSLLPLHAIKIDRTLVFFESQEMIKVTGMLKFIMP